MIAVVVFGLLLMGAVILALVEDLKSERKQIAHWRSLYETSVAGARELRHELTEARNATAKALGQGTRMAKLLHEADATIAASEEALAKAAELIADLKLAQLAVEAQSKRTVPHNDGGAN